MKYITVTLLKELREQKGWSQELLAEYSGLSKRTIQRIESGANTTVESAQSLAATLNLSSYHELCTDSSSSDSPAKETAAVLNVNELISYFKRNPSSVSRFLANLIAMTGCCIFVPIWFLGSEKGDPGTLGYFALVLGSLYISAVGSLSRKISAATQAISTAFILGLLWSHSAPTSGWGTFFYTDAQVANFKQLEGIRESMDNIQKTFVSIGQNTIIQPSLSISPPEFWGAQELIIDESGNILFHVEDKNLCDAINEKHNSETQNAIVPLCDSTEASGVMCCLSGA